MRFEVDRNVAGQFIWRLRANNNLIIANGESYPAKHNCEHAIMLVKGSRLDQYWVFQDRVGQWRWHMKAANNEIVAQSSEGYHHKQDCESAARLTQGTNLSTPVHDLTAVAAARW